MMVLFSTAQEKMADSSQTSSAYAKAKENGIVFRSVLDFLC